MTPRRWGAFLLVLTVAATLFAACKAPPASVSSFTPPTAATPRVLAKTDTPALPGLPPPTRIAAAALATGTAVTVYTSPDAPTPALTLPNPTIEAVPLALLAVDQQGEWLQVRYPERPNGTLGWVRQHEVSLAPVDNRVVVSLGQKMVRVLDRNDVVLYETDVAVGKPRTPTPLGRFYIDISMPNPGSPYGAHLLSVSGFSDVLKTFGGGRGQIALHGWSDPSVMGRAVSNGCIRMRNADISHLATLAPLGTPVEVIP